MGAALSPLLLVEVGEGSCYRKVKNHCKSIVLTRNVNSINTCILSAFPNIDCVPGLYLDSSVVSNPFAAKNE